MIELSGVADPAAVKYNLAQGGVATARVVTLVDSNAFPQLYHSWDVMEYRDDLGGGKDAAEQDPCVAMKKARKGQTPRRRLAEGAARGLFFV